MSLQPGLSYQHQKPITGFPDALLFNIGLQIEDATGRCVWSEPASDQCAGHSYAGESWFAAGRRASGPVVMSERSEGAAMKGQVHGCGLEAALAVVGGKWKPIVLWHLAPGPRRFGELRRLVAGISEKMLIQQLREMEADGIVARKDFREIPPRVEYSLTPFGVSLSHALRPLCDWGKEHMSRIGKAKAEAG